MAGTPTLDPPKPEVAPFAYGFHIPRDPRAVGVTRTSLRAALTAHGVPELIDRAQLLASELLTNALLHGCGEAELRLTWTPATLRIAVRDTGPGLPQAATPQDDGEHGRGLYLLAVLADRWDYFCLSRDPYSKQPSKVVWCEISPSLT